MKNEKRSEPELRFPEHTGAWKQCKLGELYFERKEKGNEELPILSVSIHSGVSDGELNEEDLGKNVRRSEDKSTYKHVYPGDLVFNMMRAWQGAIGVVKSEGMISPAYISAIPNNNVFPMFMDYALRRTDSISQINDLSYGVTDFRKRLYWDSFIKVNCSIPSVDEQKKIWTFFHLIDNAIVLYQRKCDELKNYKKGLLQQMFPQAGELVPRIRFPGFTDPWEQRKLGDVFEEYSEKNHEELPALTIVQGKGTILREESDRNLQYDKSSLSGYKMVHKDDFIVHLRSFEGGLEKANSDGIVSPAYHMFHGNNTDSRFYYPLFRSRQFINVLLKPHVYGIRDGKSIDITGMKTIMIPVPSYEEQAKIGDLIESLDATITLHQRKCDELKNYKKGFLQKMFV